MISKELELSLEATIREARNRKHEYLTGEHILFAVLYDEWGSEVVTQCGGDVAKLKAAIEDFFDRHIPKLTKEEGTYPQPTLGFHRVLQRALEHVQVAGKTVADAGDILASLLVEDDSHAVHFLQNEGVTRIDVLNYISHRLTKVPESSADEGSEPRRSTQQEKEEKQSRDPRYQIRFDCAAECSR